MGVTPAVHVLVVAGSSGVPARLGVERAVRALDWVPAWSPAEADVLVVCGSVAEDIAQRIWQQLPGPRARVDLARSEVTSPEGVRALLAGAADTLRDRDHQDELARQADEAVSGQDEHEQQHSDDAASDGAGHGSTEHGDHGAGTMSGPDGIALAGSSDSDRDGLEMDEWHMVLGAGLPGWPAGLVLRVTLHGDVVTAIETLAEPGGAGSAGLRTVPSAGQEAAGRPALLLDAAAAVLELAGWSSCADAARRLRDAVLTDRDPTGLAPAVDHLVNRVRRSWLLRWSLQGVRRRADSVTAGQVVRVRLLGLLEEAAKLLRDPAAAVPPPAPEGLADLRHLAVGQELGTLRLLVASLALDAQEVARA